MVAIPRKPNPINLGITDLLKVVVPHIAVVSAS